jgi:hypothetical protein
MRFADNVAYEFEEEALFDGDITLCQEPSRDEARTPEEELWIAVLKDLVMVRNHRTWSPIMAKQAQRDEKWVRSRSKALSSFEWVCESLGLVPEVVRRAYFSL